MRRLLLTIALALLLPGAAHAQASIDPGMSRDEVVARLGKPMGERTSGAVTYLFYTNGCERRCGFNDVVILENGAVVDAVFRGGRRTFTGTSSSPAGTAPVRSASAGIGGGAPASARPAARRRTRPAAPSVAAPPAASDTRLPVGARQGGIVVGNPSNAPAAAQQAPQSGATATPANSTSGTTPVTGPGGAPLNTQPPVSTPAGSAATTPAPVTQPAIPPAARPDSTSIPPLPSVPDQRTGVPPGQRPSALDSARLERLERQQRQLRDSTRKP